MIIIHDPIEPPRRRPTARELIEAKFETREWIARLRRTLEDLKSKLKLCQSMAHVEKVEDLIDATNEKIAELQAELRQLCGRSPMIVDRTLLDNRFSSQSER